MIPILPILVIYIPNTSSNCLFSEFHDLCCCHQHRPRMGAENVFRSRNANAVTCSRRERTKHETKGWSICGILCLVWNMPTFGIFFIGSSNYMDHVPCIVSIATPMKSPLFFFGHVPIRTSIYNPHSNRAMENTLIYRWFSYIETSIFADFPLPAMFPLKPEGTQTIGERIGTSTNIIII